MSNVRATWPYRKRRQYTPEFKAQLVAESQIPWVPAARIALDNYLNGLQLFLKVQLPTKQVSGIYNSYYLCGKANKLFF